ncbi:MAG: polyketide cyclase, partial [Clostridia bacterium]
FLKPFIKRYLKTQQARFVADLEAELRHAESVSCHR